MCPSKRDDINWVDGGLGEVDPVIMKLIAGVRATSLVWALAEGVSSGSKNRGEKARKACVDVVAETFNSQWCVDSDVGLKLFCAHVGGGLPCI